MKTWTAIALAAVVLAAGGNATARAQDPVSEKQKQFEDMRRAQVEAQENAAKKDDQAPEQLVARAKLLADSEHDYEKALALVQRFAGAETVAPDLRAQALVLAAHCLTQLGKNDEARANLRIAAQLKGPAADEAKRLLDGGMADQQLELRIAKAIEELFGVQAGDGNVLERMKKSRDAEDLIWLGAPAVPRIVRVLGDADHLANVTGAAYLLARIDSEDAANAIREAVKRTDPLYRRAILSGIVNLDNAGGLVDWRIRNCRAAIMSLLSDADVHVKKWILKDAWRATRNDDLLPLTRDADDDIRISAWSMLRMQLSLNESTIVVNDALVAALRRCLREDHDPVRIVAASVFASSSGDGVLISGSARELFVESLLDPVLTGRDAYWISAPSRIKQFDSPLPLALLLRVGNALGTCGHSEAGDWHQDGDARHRAWAAMTVMSSKARVDGGTRAGWSREDREESWQLLALGIGRSIPEWIAANAQQEDLPAIVQNCVRCGDVQTVSNAFGSIFTSSTAPGVTVTRPLRLRPEARAAIARDLLRVLEADVATKDPDKVYSVRQIRENIDLLVRLGDPASDAALTDLFAKTPNLELIVQLIQRSSPPVDLASLPRLMSIPTLADKVIGQARNEALGRLAAAHSPDLPRLIGRAYELGLEAPPTQYQGEQRNQARVVTAPSGIMWLVAKPQEMDPATRTRPQAQWGPTYSESDLRAAFEVSAPSKSSRFWYDVMGAIWLLPEQGPFDAVGQTLLELATRHAGDLGDINFGSKRDFIHALLQRRPPGWERFALEHVLDEKLSDDILSWLPDVTAELLERVAPRGERSGTGGPADAARANLVSRLSMESDASLRAKCLDYVGDPNPNVRVAAIHASLEAFSDRALDRLLPLSKDVSSTVRYALAEDLGTVFDQRSVPVLIDLLQDPNPGVRGVAKKSLDSIQYVFDQQQKWKRVFEDVGLDAPNAAEALVKQAAAGQPKATRLVAIESLGTLGVAETLPVLIQFMADGDAEIAAAAKDAVTRINRAAKPAKDAKTPADH